MIRKIVITGPESTGKTTLANSLAEHYNSISIPEYAREFLDNNSLSYTYDDLLTIAKEQIRVEDAVVSRLETIPGNQLPVFMDTDLLVLKIWCEKRFNNCHTWILNQLAFRKPDLYLLCDTDLPWEFDLQREAADLGEREILMRHYKEALISQIVPWALVSGTDGRTANAIRIIDQFFI